MQETEEYVTIKDRKDEFLNKIPCRLINPSKSSIGKISKAILDTNNKNAVRSTEINQRKNTSNVIDWYAHTTCKNTALFVWFENLFFQFFPSLTSDLLHNSIQFAKEVATVSDKWHAHYYAAKKNFYFLMKKTWVKTCGGEDFDVIVECYDGAEKTFPNYWQIYRTSYLLVYKDMMDLLFYKTFKAHKLNGRKGYYWNYIIEMFKMLV